jgi:glutamate:GABA antiporter
VFTWATVAVAVASFKFGKWGPNIGTIVKIAVVLIFFVLAIAFLVSKGQPAGTIGASDLQPSITGFLGVVGVLVFLWVGFELSNGASEEMVNPQRDVPVMVVGSGLIAAVLYAMVIGGILLVIPKADLTNVAGFTDAYDKVAGVLGSGKDVLGPIFGILIILTLFGSGVVWLMGADRVQAVAALDGAAPAWMGKFTSFGTPLNVNVLSGLVGSALVVMGFTFTHGSLGDFFGIALTLAISTATLCYTFMFLVLPILRRKYPDVHRPYRVPGGLVGCWICAILADLFVIVTGVTLLWPGLVESLLGQDFNLQDYLGLTVSRGFFEVATLGTFAAMILLAIVFWAVGRRNLESGLAGELDELDVTLPELGQVTPPAGGGARM